MDRVQTVGDIAFTDSETKRYFCYLSQLEVSSRDCRERRGASNG